MSKRGILMGGHGRSMEAIAGINILVGVYGACRCIGEMVSYSVHVASLMPNIWLNHLPTPSGVLLPLGDRTVRQSAMVWRFCPWRAEPSKPDSSASWIWP